MLGENGAGRPNPVPDAMGLTLPEALQLLEGWQVRFVSTRPPGQCRTDNDSSQTLAPLAECAPGEARRGMEAGEDWRVLRQARADDNTVVLTIAPEQTTDAKGRVG